MPLLDDRKHVAQKPTNRKERRRLAAGMKKPREQCSCCSPARPPQPD